VCNFYKENQKGTTEKRKGSKGREGGFANTIGVVVVVLGLRAPQCCHMWSENGWFVQHSLGGVSGFRVLQADLQGFVHFVVTYPS